jgi:hypothetical protein
MSLSKNGILQSPKQFRKVDLDLWAQNATFSSELFLSKFLMFLSKNGIFQSAKQFCKVDLDSWGQNATFFFQAFFDKIFDVFVNKWHLAKC